MRGILRVLCVAVALAATGCVSSSRTGVHTGDDGLCQAVELEGVRLQYPEFLTLEQVGSMEFVLTLDPEHESLSEARETIEGRRTHQFESVELPNRIVVRLFPFVEDIDAQEMLDEVLRWRDGREWPLGVEFSPPRRFNVDGRSVYGYSESWHHSACGGTVVRGWRVVVPIEGVDNLYAIVIGEWENVWHPLMSPALDAVISGLSVESAETVRRPCPEPDGEEPPE